MTEVLRRASKVGQYLVEGQVVELRVVYPKTLRIPVSGQGSYWLPRAHRAECRTILVEPNADVPPDAYLIMRMNHSPRLEGPVSVFMDAFVRKHREPRGSAALNRIVDRIEVALDRAKEGDDLSVLIKPLGELTRQCELLRTVLDARADHVPYSPLHLSDRDEVTFTVELPDGKRCEAPIFVQMFMIVEVPLGL